MKDYILISPYSRKLRNGKENPKNYPYWKELVSLLKKNDFYIIQTGISGESVIEGVDEVRFNLKLKDLKELILNSFIYISVDNFFQHYASSLKKRGIVLWSKSDPNIFGYDFNINLLKDRKYLRKGVYQFFTWETEEFNKDYFVDENVVFSEILKLKNNI